LCSRNGYQSRWYRKTNVEVTATREEGEWGDEKYRLLGRWLKVVIQETDGEVPFISEDIACQKRGRGDWDNHHPNPCECIFYAFSNITRKLLSFYCTE
jgi:hypothetical protein